MNCKQFYDEVVNSNLCPDGFDEIYRDFRKFQDLAMKTLLVFHQICEENSIHYQLAFGSLLGAIRDNGQIPWDYDIDVIIPFEERFKLVEALNKSLPKEYYYYCPETNKECRHFFMRVTPKGYRSDRLHVDVFYMIGAPKDEKDRVAFKNKMMKWFDYRYIKLVNVNDYPSYKKRIKLIIKKISLLCVPITIINRMLIEICEMYNPAVTNVSIPVITAYKQIYWETDELWDTKLIETDQGVFRIPKNYDKILKTIYKDYNRIYPLENRISEMLSTYGNIAGNDKLMKIKTSGRYYLSS